MPYPSCLRYKASRANTTSWVAAVNAKIPMAAFKQKSVVNNLFYPRNSTASRQSVRTECHNFVFFAAAFKASKFGSMQTKSEIIQTDLYRATRESRHFAITKEVLQWQVPLKRHCIEECSSRLSMFRWDQHRPIWEKDITKQWGTYP